MTRIEKSIEIKATPEKVFNYIKNFEKQPEYMPGIKEHTITSEKKEGIGTTSHCVTEAGGRKVEWDGEITEWEENKKLAWRCKPPLKNKGGFTLEPTDEGTRVTFVMEYELPYSVIGKIIDKIKVSKEMEEGVSKGLEKLKDILEK